MEKKLALICGAAALALSAVTLLVVVFSMLGPDRLEATPSPAAALDADAAYRLEKLNQINDMVLERQVVSEDYLRYLDDALAEQVKAYNVALVNAKGTTVRYAKEWADTFRDMSPEDDWYDEAYARYGRYLKEGDNYCRFIEEFSTALLYPNPNDFTLFGTVVGYPAGSEMGGSGGLWAVGYYLDKGPIEDLTAAVDGLLDRFDAARAAAEG